MKLESDGLLIGMREMGERDSVATVFTNDFGVLRGVMRAAQIAKKNRPLVGQVGFCAWNARLDTQLGAFHWESARNMAAPLMLNARRLMLMNSAFALIGALLPEREQYSNLYTATIDMLRDLNGADADDVYLTWEVGLLRELGYALDLTHCSGCGGVHDLCYLSPRTGRAVCADCGAPYAPRLYKLPLNLNTTLHFIDSICAGLGTAVPAARMRISGE